ncbi:MAG: HEAT repeat domain-containing protein [Ilumatobacteraceae bacterium]
MSDQPTQGLLEQLRARTYEGLSQSSIEPAGASKLASELSKDYELCEQLLIATSVQPRRWFDWNVGFITSQLEHEMVAEIVHEHGATLLTSEGIAWGLGELGSDDERIVQFLFRVCEACRDYDAWWCAADALEKLAMADAVDLKKRTLKGSEWDDLAYCLARLSQRPAVIGVLRAATIENVPATILPACREALRSRSRPEIQNAVWLLERLRVTEPEALEGLLELFEKAEDVSHTLRPRIVEALGEIASPGTRLLLESAVGEARYYRTHAYAARGLGKIGDSRSLATLYAALESEGDDHVVAALSEAICAIEHPSSDGRCR